MVDFYELGNNVLLAFKNFSVKQLESIIWSWPLLTYIIIASVLCSFVFKFVQIRYFFKSWVYLLKPEGSTDVKADMTPLQAFINSLSASIGNGSLGGMAVAVALGGPGAGFWALVFGILLMSLRFAEVYLSTDFAARLGHKGGLGGPMLYLRSLKGGRILAYVYAIGLLMCGFTLGDSWQTNATTIAINRSYHVSEWIIATVFFLFIAYVVYGGVKRVIRVAEIIVPIKVGLFFIASFILLAYHYQNLLGALKEIIESAFTAKAFFGATAGAGVTYTIQMGMTHSMKTATTATEAGLGTSAILFGATGSKEPVKNGVMSIASTFLSTLACFLIALALVASGAWKLVIGNPDIGSTALTTEAFKTVFGNFGAPIVIFLSASFGLGVFVTYVYLTREAWLYLTGGKFEGLFSITYAVVAFFGALLPWQLIWAVGMSANAVMLLVNIFGLLAFLPYIKRGLTAFENKNKAS